MTGRGRGHPRHPRIPRIPAKPTTPPPAPISASSTTTSPDPGGRLGSGIRTPVDTPRGDGGIRTHTSIHFKWSASYLLGYVPYAQHNPLTSGAAGFVGLGVPGVDPESASRDGLVTVAADRTTAAGVYDPVRRELR